MKLDKRKTIGTMLLVVMLIVGCATTKTGKGVSPSRVATITVTSGMITLDVAGQIGEDLYYYTDTDTSRENMVAFAGQRTRKEVVTLLSGQEYKLRIKPAEVVVIIARAIDDAELTVSEYGHEKKYSLSNTNHLGTTFGFRN
jgi:hypothetical protein